MSENSRERALAWADSVRHDLERAPMRSCYANWKDARAWLADVLVAFAEAELPPAPASARSALEADRRDLVRLWNALDEIAHSPHCAYPDPLGPALSDLSRQYAIGVADGHRCAAAKARAALSAAPPAPAPAEDAMEANDG